MLKRVSDLRDDVIRLRATAAVSAAGSLAEFAPRLVERLVSTELRHFGDEGFKRALDSAVQRS